MMANFVKVTDAKYDRTLYLNLDLIRFMERRAEGVTLIFFLNSPTEWEVEETPEKILNSQGRQ